LCTLKALLRKTNFGLFITGLILLVRLNLELFGKVEPPEEDFWMLSMRERISLNNSLDTAILSEIVSEQSL
jgi:hypothetical protein